MRFSPGARLFGRAAAILAILGLPACDDPADPRLAADLAVVAGNDQVGTVGEPLPDPLRVRVTDQHGEPLAGSVVAWRASGGTVGRDTTVTGADGIAAASLTLGGEVGEKRAWASVAAVGEVEFQATAVAGAPAAIVASPDSLTFTAVGDTVAVDATVRDRFGNVVADATVAWMSSDTAVVAVGPAGRVASRGGGVATVTAAAGEVTATVEAIVAQVPDRVALAFELDTLTALGDTADLEPRVVDANGFAIEGSDIAVTTPDTAVVSIDGGGRVVARAPGRAEITATAADAVASATVVVDQRVATLALGPPPDTMRGFGETVTIEPIATDRNGHEVDTTIDWVSEDPAIATVEDGTVTARGRGRTRVVASADGVTDATVITVIPWGRVTVSMELNRWEIYDVVFPITERYGLTGNIEIATFYIGDPDRITVAQIREMHDAGWAVVPHSRTLPNLTELTDAELRDEVLGSQQWVRDHGFRGAETFIVPYHQAGEREMALIREHFSAARRYGYLYVGYMVNWPPADPYGITGLEGEDFLDTVAGLEELRQLWLDAIHQGRLLEIYFHRVKESQAAGFQRFVRELAEYDDYVATFADLFE